MAGGADLHKVASWDVPTDVPAAAKSDDECELWHEVVQVTGL